METRTVILHYHLFKNAGTSLDQILKQNFPGRWVTREFPKKSGDNSALVADWIGSNPEAVAFSTHTARGPIPAILGTRIISVMFFRDPLERILSAYRFERRQEAETFGARLAKETDLKGYVQDRLARSGDRQCRNFQTESLAGLVPGDGPELERAKRGLQMLSLAGLVEDFEGSVQRLAQILRPHFPDFAATFQHKNISDPGLGNDHEERAYLKQSASHANADDFEILAAARQLLNAQSGQSPP